MTMLFTLGVFVWNIGMVWNKIEQKVEEKKQKYRG